MSFGTQDRSAAKVRTGGTSAEVSIWTSDTILSAMLSGGAGKDGIGEGLVLTTQRRGASWSLPLSYDLPALSAFAYQNGPVLMPKKQFLYGSGFGHNSDYTVQARFLSTAAASTRWITESSVIAKTPFGIFRYHAIIITAGGDVRASLTKAYSYDGTWPYPAFAGSTSGLSPFPSLGNGPTSGSKNYPGILVLGLGFDTRDKSTFLRVGGTDCESSVWLSDTAISAYLSHGSLSRNMLDVVVTVDIHMYYVNTLTQIFSYQAPVPISNSNVPFRAGAASAVELQGMNFGTVSSSLMSRIASTACETTIWHSESSLSCQVPMGVQGTLPLTITAGSQGE